MSTDNVKLKMMLNALSTWNGHYTEEYVTLFTPKGFDINEILEMPQPIKHYVGGHGKDTSIKSSDIYITIYRKDGGYEVTSYKVNRTKS